MRVLFVPPNNWATHPNPMRHHFLYKRLARRYRCEVYVVNFDGLGSSHTILNRDLVLNDNIHLIGQYALPASNPASYYTLNLGHIWSLISRALAALDIEVVVHSNILPSAAVCTLAQRKKIPIVYDYADYYPQSSSAYFLSLIHI